MPESTVSTCPIPARSGVVGFVASWLAAAVASSIPILLFVERGATPSIPLLAVSLVLGWSALLIGATLTSRMAGSGDVVGDLGIDARPIDLVGLPIGVVAQLALIPLVYVPLRALWPETFSDDALSETATDLIDRADGLQLMLLFVLVALGAPVVEEIVYRGLLQRSMSNLLAAPATVVLVAAVFALVHLRPIEFPGLFAVGLVFGVCAWWTGRLGMAVAAHVGFNFIGLLLAL